MTVLAATNPVAEAVFGVLTSDATLSAAVEARIYDDLPEDVQLPCVLYEVLAERNIRGMGTTGPRELEIRTHAFSNLGSMSEAQRIDGLLVGLLDLAILTIAGFAMCGTVWHHESVPLPDQELRGVKCHEVVGLHTLTVEAV